MVKILKEAGILAAPVMNDKEVYESEHFRQRGTVRWLDDPLFGDILDPQRLTAPACCPRPPGRLMWQWRPVGADNVKIYHELLGYPMSKIEELYNRNIL